MGGDCYLKEQGYEQKRTGVKKGNSPILVFLAGLHEIHVIYQLIHGLKLALRRDVWMFGDSFSLL